MNKQIRLNCDDNELDIIHKFTKALREFGIVIEDDGEPHDGFMILNVSVAPEMKEAITRVFDDGAQNWDRGDGWEPDDRHKLKSGTTIREGYELVQRLTEYADKPKEDDDE